MKARTFFVISIIFFSLNFQLSGKSWAEQVKPQAWSIEKSEWSSSDELGYSEFVASIGEGRAKNLCKTIDECLKSPIVNSKFANITPKNLNFYSDCADLPFVLRGYYAWMNNLPFTFPVQVEKAAPASDGIALDPSVQEDIRYTVNGNKVLSRYVVKTGDRADQIFQNISNLVSSAMYRIHPNSTISEDGQFSDFYPVKITRESIKPGTVLYDPAGHVLVVYKVESNGRIRLIDAHPDNSLTRQIYGDKFMRANPAAGAGFKAFRPFKVLDSGKIQARFNYEIKDFSVDQQYGERRSRKGWQYGKFFFDGNEVDYYKWVRKKLSQKDYIIDPIAEFSDLMDSLCDDLQARNEAVNTAVAAGLNNRKRPQSLPENIYGTSGDWETYSTPSRDARFKASIKETIFTAEEMILLLKQKNQTIKYDGSSLAEDFKKIYAKKSNTCRVYFRGSSGLEYALNLDQIIENIFSLSFDPYHCIELRWGLLSESANKTCERQEGLRWYYAQDTLRRIVVRDYALFTGYDFFELGKVQFPGIERSSLSIRDFLDKAK